MSKNRERRAAQQHSPEIAIAFQKARALHLQGQSAQAEPLFRAILKRAPNHLDALQLLAGIEYQRQNYEAAVQLMRHAAKLDPKSAAVHSNIGIALCHLNRNEQALASFDRALTIKPDYAEALNNRGNALRALGRREEALASYDRALAIKPDYLEALDNRGSTLIDLNRHGEALESYDRALATKPDYVEAVIHRVGVLINLNRCEEALASCDRALALNRGLADVWISRGNILFELKRHEEALTSYDRALAIKPGSAEAMNYRGLALRGLQRDTEALASFDRALAVKPDYAEALNHRGVALLDLMHPDQALATFDRALALSPDHAEALNNRGLALQRLERREEALASFDRALVIKPDYAGALTNRGNSLRDLNRYEEEIENFERLLSLWPDYNYARGNLIGSQLACCEWRNYDRDVVLIEKDVEAHKRAVNPFTFLCVSGSPAAQQRCAEAFSKDRYIGSQHALWKGELYRHDRIRVAYLSSDFRSHAIAHLTAGLFEAHDKRQFQTTALSLGPDDKDEMRKRLEPAFDLFIDVRRMNDRDLALKLKQMEIDIVVDLNGYTQGARTGILAFRPAPIQVNYLGYPGTLGADYVDYIIADRIVIPEHQQSFYSEKVVYLPDTYQPNDSKRLVGSNVPTRVEAGLPETGFVFCSFNNNYKIAPIVFDVWMRLLHAIEGSVIWLLGDNPVSVRNLRREAEQRGVASERLVFASRVTQQDHLARHRLADLFLDTLPYNAHTTASDALWAGLPVVTCLGTTFAGRVAGSLLDAVGLPELTTGTLEEYEALALDLAQDATRLAAIKAKLATNRHTYPLFDTDRYRRHIESAFITMWERYQRGEPPIGFTVTPVQSP